MTTNRDEIRRQLHDAENAQAEALPRWRSALGRSASGDRPTVASEATTAALLGVPTRRGFLKVGGVTIAGAALAAACTPAPKEEQLAQTGTTPTTAAKATYEPQGDIATDITLLRVAQSIEKLAIAAYDAALATDLLTPEVIEAAELFREHHNEHFEALATTLDDLGGDSFNEPNPALVETVLTPAAQSIEAGGATFASLVELAIDLEDAAAQTYNNSTSLFTTASLRQTAMSIGGVEARHVAVLLGVRSPGNRLIQVPFAFEKTADAVKPRSDAYVAVGTGSRVPTSTTSTRPTTPGSTPGTTGGSTVTTRG